MSDSFDLRPDLAYLRNSSDEQRKNETIEGQRHEVQRWFDYTRRTPAAWYVDEAVSGVLPFEERPQGSRFLGELDARRYRAVVVWKIDRLGRSALEILRVVDSIRKAGLQLVSVVEQIDTETPMGQFFLNVLASFAQLERDMIRERTVAGKRAIAAQGKLHNHSAELYGYRRDKALRRRTVHEPEAEVVRSIYRWVGEDGETLRGVLRRLNDPVTGVAPPSGRPGARWGKSQLHRVLVNPAYCGQEFGWRYRSRGAKRNPALRPREEWQRLADGTTPPIVTPALYEAVQAVLAAHDGAEVRNEARPYLLRGLVWCAVCGRRMYGGAEKGQRTYRCSSREYAAGACGGRRAAAEPLEAGVLDELRRLVADPARVRAWWDRGQQDRASGHDDELERLRKRAARLERDQQRLVRSFRESETMPWRLVEGEVAQIEKELAPLRAQLADAERKAQAQSARGERLADLPSLCRRAVERLDQGGIADQRAVLEMFGLTVLASGREWRFGDPSEVLAHRA